jgi:hypothetical protein
MLVMEPPPPPREEEEEEEPARMVREEREATTAALPSGLAETLICSLGLGREDAERLGVITVAGSSDFGARRRSALVFCRRTS